MTKETNYFCQKYDEMKAYKEANQEHLKGADYLMVAKEFAKADGHPEHQNDEHYEFYKDMTQDYETPGSGTNVKVVLDEVDAMN